MSSIASLPIGSEVDGLVIEKRVAQGASSAVYLVSDPSIGTRFALKEHLPAGLARREQGQVGVEAAHGEQDAFRQSLDRFRSEARLLASLDHPGIMGVVRYFEANGTAYLLMPWHEGETLEQQLARGPLEASQGLSTLVSSLMDSLAYLHGQGHVHQDLKPANLFIRSDGQCLLLDLGAAAADPSAQRLGTPGYAAPEQSDAQASPDWRCDVYGLAATLYRALTGTLPPRAEERLLALKLDGSDPLVPASELLPASRYGGLADALDQGLMLDPDQRPQSMASWLKAFKALDWRLMASRDDTEGFQQEKREWLPTALLGALVVAIIAMAIFLLSGRDVDIPDINLDSTRQQPVEETSAPVARPIDAEEREQWQAALDADTIGAYRRFIELYPDSIYVEQAGIQIDILDEIAWEALSSEDSLPAYEDYLEQFPEGIHQAEALRRIDAIEQEQARRDRERRERERLDNEAWQAARDSLSIQSLDGYISNWPSGLHIEDAQRIRRQLRDQANDESAWITAQRLDTRDAYQAYIDGFPAGAHITQALQAIDEATFRSGRIFRDCNECPEMIVVPAGTFEQGSDDDSELALGLEKPKRTVTIAQDFAVGMYEVTMEQWDACVTDGACEHVPTDNGWGRGQRPVIMVSWNDAQRFASWLSNKTGNRYRLPSESEWEYFARAGERRDWFFGDPSQVCLFGNVAADETEFRWRHSGCSDGSSLGTLPGGTFRPNDFGLFDVIGNVAEWTNDCMNLSYLDAPSDGSPWTRGICSSHMARGGSWVTGSRDIRLPSRFNLKNGDRNDFTGFRVVREIDED